MTAIPQPNSTRMVSERILTPLQQVARRQWSVLAARGIILTLLGGLTLILVAALLIGLFDYAAAPTIVRIVVSVLVWGAVIAGGVYFLLPAMRKRSLVQTAMEVEARLGSATHERITSSVELAAESDLRFAGSPDLVRHLIRQAEADAAIVNPERIIPADAVVKLSLLLLPVLAAWLALTLFLPHRILKPVFHLLMPWQSLPAALSDIAVQPGDVMLAQGDPLRIAVHVNPRNASDRERPVQQAVITQVDPAGQSTIQSLARLGPRDFQFSQENLQKGFRYHVGTEAGDSQTYTVTVLPRPSVDQIEIRYEYPKYTGLEPNVDRNKDDGAIDGLAGTNVTVTIHTPTALTDDSRLAVLDRVQGFKSEPKDLPLKKVGEGQYQAQLTLVNSGEYRAKLANDNKLNGANLTNKDDQPRPITVHQDEKPVVAILLPHSELTVPPTDTVPVSFQAADDFGVAGVEAMVQVEDAEPRSIPVKLAQGKDRRNVNDSVKLAVADLLKAAGKPDAHEIRYWLKATDNRDPDPQWSESAKQVLRLEKGAETAEAKLDEERAKDLIEAIRKAIEGLENARPLADQSQWIDRNRSMSGEERARSEDAQGRLEKTASELSKAADEHMADAYADMAAKAKQIAEQPIAQAAGEMGKTLLHAEQSEGAERRQDAQDAVRHIDKAKKDLEDLLKKTEDLAKALDAQHKLEELARLQQQIAEQMAQQQPDAAQQEKQDGQNKDRQQQVAQKTEETVNQTPQLQDRKAIDQARAQSELLKKIEQIREEQEKQEQQVAKQAELAEIQQQAKSIAERQEELNKKLEQFKKDDKAALEKASAEPPSRQQQDQIVKDLNAAKLPQANAEQKQSAQNLEQSTQRLEQKAASDDLKANSDEQKALDQAKKDADKANDLKQQADHAKDAAEQAKDNPDAKKDAAQQAKKAAEQIARQAKEVSKQAKAAGEQAKQAKKSANEAAEAAKRADNDAAEAAAKQAGDKADQAGEQAAAAEKSADAAQDSAQSAEQAADKGDAPEAARQARRAAEQLQQAEKQMASATKREMFARQKSQAAEAAAQAKQLAKAQAELAEATEAMANAQQQAQQEGAKPADQAAGDQRQLAQESAKAATRAQQLAAQAGQQKNPALAQRAASAQKALDQAKAAQLQAAQAEAAGNPEQAAGAQEKAENALAQAESALRGQTGEMAEANAKGQQGQAEQGQNGQGEQGQNGQGEKGQDEQGQGEKGQGNGQGQPGQGQQAQAGPAEPHPGEVPAVPSNQPGQAATPQQAMAQAAQSAQEAMAAQQQAMQGNAAASAQAASALAQAAKALAEATQPGEGQGQGQGSEPGQESAQQGEPGQNSSAKPGASSDPKSGISAQLAGGSGETPKVVQDLGVTPSDWAKLGPQQRRELLGAAQQGGPPQYQAMIKNYYVRIARMQAQGGSESGK